MPELNVYGGFGAETHLKEKDSQPDYKLYLGAVYTFDFLEMKKNPSKKSKKAADEDEEEPEDEEDW